MVESGTIKFKSKEHEKFFTTYFAKCRYKDVGRKALKSLRMSLWWISSAVEQCAALLKESCEL